MSIEPLLEEGFVVATHAFAALVALMIGAIQLVGPKGTVPHRLFGFVWAALMMYVAIGSFWITGFRIFGRWSPIHLLSILVIVTVPLAVWRAHRHQVGAHKRAMITLYLLALVVTGAFTLWPGRVMHEVLFGS